MENQEGILNGDNTEDANTDRRAAKIKAAAIALHLSGGPAPSKEVLEIIADYIDRKVTMHEVLTKLYPAFLSQPQTSRSHRMIYSGETPRRENDVSKAA